MHVLNQHISERFAMYNADCVDAVRALPDESIHYSVFSPPFASLYTYSSSPRDMGNCGTRDDFMEHFGFLAPELLRVTKPGRLLSQHVMLLPLSKTRDGEIGLHDFRGEIIRLFVDAGWIFHSEVVIWKDPVTAMQRTKALGLLHKQIKKDSCMSRQGIPDYVVTFRKPGDNPERVTHTAEDFPVSLWQRYASPVWMDINPSDTLQYRSAREDKDERHICPLQLDVIRRCLKLWTNEGDTVLSPFAGIGSEGYVALEQGRRFVGVELKASYYAQAVENLKRIEHGGQVDLFSLTRDDDTGPKGDAGSTPAGSTIPTGGAQYTGSDEEAAEALGRGVTEESGVNGRDDTRPVNRGDARRGGEGPSSSEPAKTPKPRVKGGDVYVGDECLGRVQQFGPVKHGPRADWRAITWEGFVVSTGRTSKKAAVEALVEHHQKQPEEA